MSGVVLYNSDGSVLKTLYQWDINQTLRITGLPVINSPVFHFGNCKQGVAYASQPVISGSDMYVNIPNALLQEPESIYAFVSYETPGDGDLYDNGLRTEYAFMIPVKPRPQPESNLHEEAFISQIGE